MRVHEAATKTRLRRLCAALAVAYLPWAPAALAQEGTEPAAAARAPAPVPDPLAAWQSPGDLEERAYRARIAALQVGIPSFDAPARALLLEDRSSALLPRARAAVVLAPDLPLAQSALANALLWEAHDLPGALAAAARGLRALLRHREARPWLEARGFLALRDVLVLGALCFLAAAAARHARAAAHDLGDGLCRLLPLFARGGLLGVLVLVPAMLGQGLAGTALPLFAIVLCYGGVPERRAAWASIAVMLVGLQVPPLAAARALAMLAPDPVSSAFQTVDAAAGSGAEYARLAFASSSDSLAERGLALDARRAGRLGEAADRYRALVAAGRADAALASNAGNVELALGNTERAVELHEFAVELSASPYALHNLAHAYGQAIRPQAQDGALQRLQRAAPDLAFELTQMQEKLAGGYTLDLPIPTEALRRRAIRSPAARAMTAELRRPLAPGRFGAAAGMSVALLLAAAGLARAASRQFGHSGACRGCGGRLCPRCDAVAPKRTLCAACQRLFEKPETADPERRVRRLAELEQRSRWIARARLAASLGVPGAAGLLAGRVWLGLAGALAGVAAWAPAPALADPLAAGAAGSLAFAVGRAGCFALYAAIVAAALRPHPEGTR